MSICIFTQSFMLAWQGHYTWVMSPGPACFSYFSGMGSYIFVWASLDCDPPTYTSLIAGMDTIFCCCCWDGVLLMFYPCWPKTVILLIFTSYVYPSWDFRCEPIHPIDILIDQEDLSYKWSKPSGYWKSLKGATSTKRALLYMVYKLDT
jgi:hypothetical protein